MLKRYTTHRYYINLLGSTEKDEEHLMPDDMSARLDMIDLEKLKESAGRHMFKDIFPKFDPGHFTAASLEPSEGIFLKKPPLVVPFPEYLEELKMVKDDFLVEARACEVLRHSPHPNIAKFLGCRVQGNRITGFFYERCVDFMGLRQPVNVEKFIDDVRKGIEHLHSLGYCHNDICPFNIFVKKDGTATIIDFDSCRPVGETLTKRGNGGFFDKEADAASKVNPVSAFEHDWYGLRKTKEWLIEWNKQVSRKQNSG
ncbi:unnamed protein product [Chondrus crispus]|uniref:Protein kinase domain-containing protein n=1 Tax=Chondrus crispus TaxID=2769 RepID=S0F2X9_CHOCR|nr:unnamed protein product [Chondrus crispus]CDF77511.1 unnamed protein product [Chondrus crispus]|eukprot:XP_005712550.1 unnamed protein product [Chondrus crispus]